ncbi:MAG: acyl-CoA synthetase FdrA [Chloroflexota bacterium]|nr:acyl-CoA synthetase FdrA [Chloroflexota bacterium]
MQLQKALTMLPAVLDAGVVMGTEANKQVLQQSDLLTADAQAARAEDLLIAVRAESAAAAQAALDQVDALLARRAASVASEFRPRSLDSAAQRLPQAQWVLISVPGRYAAGVARDALRLNRHVFLYSDNVPLEEEIELKRIAGQCGLLVLGPDCGTAIINGAALGFANRVRRGRIGAIGASGTGLQAVTVRIHNLGAGISQAIGTGTRDLSDAVGGITTRQALDALRRDSETEVIVLVSKPPSPAVAASVLDAARATGKPIVIDFIGYAAANERSSNLHFARTLSDAAEIATSLVSQSSLISPQLAGEGKSGEMRESVSFAPDQRYLRGLYSGGTLAYEAQLLLRDYLGEVYSNAPLIANHQLPSPAASPSHTILDLGADEFTVGRLHPMLDNDLRIRRLRQEADDPTVAVILLDVVLGFGSHPDPAGELAPAIADVLERARRAGRSLQVIAVVIGTDEDPQNLASQVQQLSDGGARVEFDHAAAVRHAAETISSLNPEVRAQPALKEKRESERLEIGDWIPVDSAAFTKPFAAINVGLESFYASLKAQDIPAVHVDWRPPAGGNEKLMAILERLKSKS